MIINTGMLTKPKYFKYDHFDLLNDHICGIFIIFDINNTIKYIGMSDTNIKKELSDLYKNKHIQDSDKFGIYTFDDINKLDIILDDLIIIFKPKYNKLDNIHIYSKIPKIYRKFKKTELYIIEIFTDNKSLLYRFGHEKGTYMYFKLI